MGLESTVVRKTPKLLLFVPVVMLSSPVWAVQLPSMGQDAAPAATASASTANSRDAGNAARQNDYTGFAPGVPGGTDYSRGHAGAAYLTGFSGCAATDTSGNGIFLGPGVTSSSQAAVAADDQGRYLALTLDAAEVYTDNLNLAPSDRAISDFITDISPHLNACADSGRIRGSLDYRLQGLIYAKNSRFNHVYNNVAGQTTIDLIGQHLFLDADTRYGQAVIDPTFGYSRSEIFRPSNNRTSRWVTNLSPYFVQSLGPVGQGTLRYRYGRSIYGDSDVPDATVNAAYLNIASPPQQTPITWNASAVTQKVHRSSGNSASYYNSFQNEFPGVSNPYAGNDSADTTYFDRVTLQLGYQLTYNLKLLATGGVEDRYRSDGTNDRLGSGFYSGGFRWDSGTNYVEARLGHRFFGTSYYLSMGHRGRIADASVSYQESPSTQGLNELNSNGAAFNSSFSTPSTSLYDRGVFIQKRANATVSIHTAVTRTTLQVYEDKRDYVSDFRGERYVGGRLRINYQFQPRMSIIPVAGYEKSDNGPNGTSVKKDVGVSLARRLGPETQAAISYGHAWRTGSNSAVNYHENRVILQISKGF